MLSVSVDRMLQDGALVVHERLQRRIYDFVIAHRRLCRGVVALVHGVRVESVDGHRNVGLG